MLLLLIALAAVATNVAAGSLITSLIAQAASWSCLLRLRSPQCHRVAPATGFGICETLGLRRPPP